MLPHRLNSHLGGESWLFDDGNGRFSENHAAGLAFSADKVVEQYSPATPERKMKRLPQSERHQVARWVKRHGCFVRFWDKQKMNKRNNASRIG